VNLEVPNVVGVPEIMTESIVLGDKLNPGGRLPVFSTQVNGPVEPPASTAPK
jgi:hypothetical protein